MKLYTCPGGTNGAVLGHPCGRAAKALDDAGFEYETETVGGFKALGFTRRGRRDTIRELTGQEDVPVLVVDEQTVVHGSGRIVEWARANAPAR